MNKENMMETRLWYSIICNEDEIDQYLNMKKADDYLLKIEQMRS